MADLNSWVVSSASLCFGPENNPSTVIWACVPIGESGKHGRAAHHAIANQRSGLLTVLRAFQPVGNRLIIAVLHLVDIVLGLDACEDAAGFVKLFGHQFVVVGQRKNGT